MRILQILPKIPFPPSDGHKKSMWGVIKYLSKRGHKIEIIAYRQNEDVEKVKTEIEKYARLHIIDVDTPNTIIGIIKNLFSPIPYNLYKYKRSELTAFLKNFLPGNNFDIIHLTNSHMGWVIDEIRKLSLAPVVLREENLELAIMEKYYRNQKNLLLKFYAYIQFKKFIKYEPVLCSKFDWVIMMSNEDKDRLNLLEPSIKSSAIPMGVEKELLSLRKENIEKYSITHIGSLKWYPNLDGFLWFVREIFPLILNKKPDAKLYIYGSDLPQNIMIDDNVMKNVVVKGFVDDLWDELKNKSIVVVPLRIGSGIRVKILELLAAGQNVISTSLGKEGLPLLDMKELLIADNRQDFAEKILDFFDNKFDSEKIIDNGKKFIEKNYLWDNVADQFEQVYYELKKN